MERPTRRLDLPAFPCSRSRPRYCHWGQLAVSRLRRMGRLQLLVLLLQLGSLALLFRVAGQIEPPPRPHGVVVLTLRAVQRLHSGSPGRRRRRTDGCAGRR